MAWGCTGRHPREHRNTGVCMGFLDKLTQQASDVASTVAEKTQEVAKSGQLQVQLRNLKGEERDALTEFGREAFNLHEANALAERSGELAGAAARIADIRAQIAAKEQEIAAVKSDGGDGGAPASDTVESSAEEVADSPAADATPTAARPPRARAGAAALSPGPPPRRCRARSSIRARAPRAARRSPGAPASRSRAAPPPD